MKYIKWFIASWYLIMINCYVSGAIHYTQLPSPQNVKCGTPSDTVLKDGNYNEQTEKSYFQ